MYIILIFSVLLLLFLQNLVIEKLWHQGLSVKLEFSDAYIYEGDEGVLKEAVTNDKRMPLPAVEVRLSISRNLRFISEAKENSTVSDMTYKRDVFSFVGRQKITRRLPFVGAKRGYYEFHGVEVCGYDFFLKYKDRRFFPQSTGVYVYPKQVPVDRINLICQDISGMIISQRKLNPDPFEFYGIREYVNTDPMNHINWKASARNGALMVNQFDSTTNLKLQILLELEDTNVWKQENLVEESIRIAASLGARLVSKQMPVTLRSNAIDGTTGEQLNLYLPVGAGKIPELNQKLACLDTEKISLAARDFLEQCSNTTGDNVTYILISKNYTEDVQIKAQQLVQNNGRLLWIVPQNTYDEPVAGCGAGITILRWEVGA